MLKVPPVILRSLSVAHGLHLGYQFLQRRRNRPALIAGSGFVLLCAWVAAG